MEVGEPEYPRVRVNADQLDQHKQQFLEFLESDNFSYKDGVETILQGKTRRMIVNLNDLREFDMELADRVLHSPLEYLLALENAVKELALRQDPSFDKTPRQEELKVGFDGAFGRNHVSPRGLSSKLLAQLVCVEGIVTKCSLVRPKVLKSVHYCRETKGFLTKDYRDATSITIGVESGGRPMLPTPTVYPSKTKDGHPLETEVGLSTYKDHQTVTIQEMPERAPLGQMPRAVNLILEYDLVDKVKPGDRVQVMGIYRALCGASGAQTSGVFQTVILANNMRLIGKDNASIKIAAEDIQHIKSLGKEAGILDLLARSYAPSIFGHDFIKKALVLQTVGGCEKVLENSTHLRGDINILMCGDPSTAKSQLLRATLNTSVLAVSTTGRGSSGVGLTAAVVTDADTGDRRLEAGAMVLADRGVVCIDEFDKMSEGDRVAIHEVMEQQTVTIAKAGIHAQLNARCSVLAAANPVYGQYNKRKAVQENIGLPDSLLSRFDLLFVVLDQIHPATDRAIAEHIIRAHSYRRPGSDMAPERLSSGPLDIAMQEEDREEHRVWEKANPLARNDGRSSHYHNRRQGSGQQQQAAGESTRGTDEILTKDFVRKYLYYAKSRIQPKLTMEAEDAVANFYATLRGKQERKTVPITPRTLETLIRLATAHAKVRLSKDVTKDDAEAAMELLSFALYHEGEDQSVFEAVHENDEEDVDGTEEMKAADDAPVTTENMDVANQDEDASGDNGTGRRRGRGDDWDDMDDDGDDDDALTKKPKFLSEHNQREETLRDHIGKALHEKDSVELDELLDELNTGVAEGGKSFDREEVVTALQRLDAEGRLYYEPDAAIVYPLES